MTPPAKLPVLPAEAAQRLDCIQTNLALLADFHHGPGTHLRWGQPSLPCPRLGPSGLPTVEPTVETHLARISQLGLATGELKRDVCLLDLFISRPGTALFVVGDAFDLSWTPYADKVHMSHSFVLWPTESEVWLIDAYDNETRYGPARSVTLPLSDVPAPSPTARATHVVPIWPASTADRIEDVASAPVSISDYVEAYRSRARVDPVGAAEAWVLECWLLRRRQALAAARRAQLDSASGFDPGADDSVARWDRVCERTFIAARRVERGGLMPASAFDEVAELLAEVEMRSDDALQQALPAPMAESDSSTAIDGHRELLHNVVENIVGRQIPKPLGSPLTSLPGVTSIRLVQIVEQLEAQAGVQLAPEDMDPAVLVDPVRLVTALRRAQLASTEGVA